MDILTIIFIILLFTMVILYIIEIIKTNKQLNILKTSKKEELKSIFKDQWKKEEFELNQKVRQKQNEVNLQIKSLEDNFKIEKTKTGSKINRLNTILKEKEERYEEVNQDLDVYRKGKLEEIDNTAAEYEQRKRIEVAKNVKQYNDFLKEGSQKLQDQLKEAEDEMKNEIEEIKSELEEERAKRAAINEKIRKQRELEEQQDFYRIQIDSRDIDDIKILRNIAPRLRHPEAIHKAIWSGYYQKPLAELRKRLLPNGDVSCVYMVTRMKTKEMYIGQTTSFDKRIQEHTRSALGIGTLASSLLHRKMLEDGPEQFLWQILEVVPKDKLRERESYYIDFFKSNKFGLNTVSGDKK